MPTDDKVVADPGPRTSQRCVPSSRDPARAARWKIVRSTDLVAGRSYFEAGTVHFPSIDDALQRATFQFDLRPAPRRGRVLAPQWPRTEAGPRPQSRRVAFRPKRSFARASGVGPPQPKTPARAAPSLYEIGANASSQRRGSAPPASTQRRQGGPPSSFAATCAESRGARR